MKKKILLLFFMIYSSNSIAGYHDLTFHSRANCINNESISWYKDRNFWLWTVSRHIKGKDDHQLIDDWRYTWRSAGVHWGEGTTGGWTVHGEHWLKYSWEETPTRVAVETVTDCSIYDGWWD